MAFIDTIVGHPEWPSFYNVNSAVGFGCPNLEEDVKVIQFFLQRFFTVPSLSPYKPSGTLAVDGKVGPVTRAWIIKAQKTARLGQQNVLVDGIIDKAGHAGVTNNGKDELSSISHTPYTIHKINAILRHADTAVYKTLSTNPVVPPDVRMIFMQINAQGPAMNYGQV